MSFRMRVPRYFAEQKQRRAYDRSCLALQEQQEAILFCQILHFILNLSRLKNMVESEVGMNKQSLQCFLRKSSRCNVKRKGLLGIFPKSLSVRRTFANRRLLKYVKKIKNRSQRKVKTFVLVGSRTAQPVEA